MELRGGTINEVVGVFIVVVFLNWYDSLFGAEAFNTVHPPHLDPVGWLQGRYNKPFGPDDSDPRTPTPTSTQIAVIPTKAQEFNDISLNFNKPRSQYVMTKGEALGLIAKTYPGQMEVTDNERITDWQAAKHLHHGIGVGVDPEMYGMTQEQLTDLSKDGLTEYVRKGNKLPSIEHVKAYQEALKNICENSQKRTDSKYYYKHGVTPATVYYDEHNRIIVCFNQTTGDLITGDRQREKVFNRFMAHNTLGALEWITKWRNN